MEWIIFGILAMMFILLIIILQEILNIKDRIDTFDADIFLIKIRINECLDSINNNKQLFDDIKSSLNIDILKNINNLINDRFDKNTKEIELFKQIYNNNIEIHLRNFNTILSALGDLKDNIKCNKSNNSITTQLDSLKAQTFEQLQNYNKSVCQLITDNNKSYEDKLSSTTEVTEDNITKFIKEHFEEQLLNNQINKLKSEMYNDMMNNINQINKKVTNIVDIINNTNNINNTDKSNKAKNSSNNNKTNKLLSQKKKSNTKLKTATTFDNGDTHE